jgi:excisionase family DNA binding protein
MELQKPTFEQLPFTVDQLNRKLDDVLHLLKQQANLPTTDQPDRLLNIREAGEFLTLARPTIYALVSKGQIPFCKPKGTKRLYFNKQELSDWVQSGRKQTISEIKEQATTYLKPLKKRRLK